MTANGGVGGRRVPGRPSYSIRDTTDPFSHIDAARVAADHARVSTVVTRHCGDDTSMVLMMLGLTPTPERVKPERKPASARRTHCPKGHEYTPDNTYMSSGAARRCKTCMTEQHKKYRTAASA